MAKFNSLHNHFRWSKLDSMLPLKDAIKLAKDYGMDALAISDHGNICGAVEFYLECNKQGIKPVLGMEIYLTEDRLIKSRKEMQDNGSEVYHLILYAKSDKGLGNLYQIASEAANGGQFDDNERIDLQYIRDNMLYEDVVCTSACMGGPIGSWLMCRKGRQPDNNRAIQWAKDLRDTFNDFYIELSCNELVDQVIINQELMDIANHLSIPIVISGDTHYLRKEDAKIHDVLLCINTNRILSDPDRFKFPSDEFYLLHPDEVEAYCNKYNIPLVAMDNTIKISEMCNASPMPKDKRGLLPPYEVPEKYTEETYLSELCYDNLIELAKRKNIDYATYSKRLAYELDIVCMKGYAGYFLILWDIIDWCKKNNIYTGPGRGSAAGALVSYLLGITKLDPIVHGLYFERFLNPDKDAFPDIDSDFEYLRREEVIRYILDKYGEENVSQIITFGTLKLKSGIRKIMKALEYTSAEITEVVSHIPDKMPDQSDTEYFKFAEIIVNPDKYKKDYGEDKFKALYTKVSTFMQYMGKYHDVNTALQKLEGIITNFGVHPSGVVIAPRGKLKKGLPTKKFDSAPLPVCQFDMENIDIVKALKLDVLGLKTLSVIDIACTLAGIDKYSLDVDDYDAYPEVYAMLRDGLTKEVFQVSSIGMTKMIQDMQLENFSELTDALALFRPGPLTAIDDNTGLTMVETYIKSKRDKTITSINPAIDDIFAETKGCMVYQEQLLAVAQKISGYTLGQADNNIRKPVGKKKINEFPAIRAQFVDGDKDVKGAINNGFDLKTANDIFDMILCFGGYGFNKSHSACYADLSFKTAYLKRHHPEEFMCAVMTVYSDNIDEIIECIVECKKMCIEVLPPNINDSEVGFGVKIMPTGKKAIVYGLSAIKGIGAQAAEEVIRHRPYTSFLDYMTRVHDTSNNKLKANGKKETCPLSKRNEPVLIKAGCFDTINDNRNAVLNEYMTLRKEKDWIPLDPNKYDRQLKLELEKELLGMYISDHPLKSYPFTRWNEVWDGDEIIIGGIISKFEIVTKNNNKYCTGTLETLEDKRRFIIGSRTLAKLESKLKKNTKLVIYGTKNEQWSNINVTNIKTIVHVTKPQQQDDFVVDIDEEVSNGAATEEGND